MYGDRRRLKNFTNSHDEVLVRSIVEWTGNNSMLGWENEAFRLAQILTKAITISSGGSTGYAAAVLLRVAAVLTIDPPSLLEKGDEATANTGKYAFHVREWISYLMADAGIISWFEYAQITDESASAKDRPPQETQRHGNEEPPTAPSIPSRERADGGDSEDDRIIQSESEE